MPGDQYEPNRVLGFPVRPRGSRDPAARDHAGRDHAGRDRAARDEEPQRVAGFPVDWFSGAGPDWLGSLAHPVREFRRWRARRPPGPHAADDD